MAAANRYSRVVARLKVALPLIALGLLSTLFLFSRTPDPDDALPFAEVDVERLAREQRLSRPRFAGTLEDGREVTLVADSAAPQAGNPNRIRLAGVESLVVLSDEDILSLRAAEGDIDLAGQHVTLSGDVRAETSGGLSLASQEITVSMDRMNLASPGQIALTGEGLVLEAGSMDMTGPEGAAFLSFAGGVRLLYDPED